jgi:hypothetical protein
MIIRVYYFIQIKVVKMSLQAKYGHLSAQGILIMI